MTEYLLTISDGLKRSLGYIDEDNSLDVADESRMGAGLKTAESFVQNAVGTDITDFYSKDTIKPLYTQACNALAATYYQNPASFSNTSTVAIDAVCNSIIGQLRGLYDSEVVNNGSNSQSDKAEPAD